MKRLGAVLVLLVLLMSTLDSRVGATGSPTYTVHGGDTHQHPTIVMGMAIRSTVSLVVRIQARRGLGLGKWGLWSAAVQQEPGGMVMNMSSGFALGGDPPITGTTMILGKSDCTPACFVYVRSQDILWTLSVIPPSAVIKFVPPKILGLK